MDWLSGFSILASTIAIVISTRVAMKARAERKKLELEVDLARGLKLSAPNTSRTYEAEYRRLALTLDLLGNYKGHVVLGYFGACLAAGALQNLPGHATLRHIVMFGGSAVGIIDFLFLRGAEIAHLMESLRGKSLTLLPVRLRSETFEPALNDAKSEHLLKVRQCNSQRAQRFLRLCFSFHVAVMVCQCLFWYAVESGEPLAL